MLRLKPICLCLVLLAAASLSGCQSLRSKASELSVRKGNSRQPVPTAGTQGQQTAQSQPETGDEIDEIRLVSDEAGGAELSQDPELGEQSTLNLAMLEGLAMQHNPAIRQASASAYKGYGIRDQVGRLPNPTVGYSGQQLKDAGTDQHMLTFSQDIVTGNKLELNRRVMDQAIQAQLWQVETQRQRVLTDVRVQFYEALAAERRLKLTKEFEQVALKGVQVAVSRKDGLEGSRPEVLQAEIQLQEVELQQQQTDYELQAAWKELVATIGLPDLPMNGIEGAFLEIDQPRDWGAVFDELAASSPELKAACARISKATANLDRQRVQAIPNLGVGLSVGRDRGTGSDFYQAEVGVPVPVFNRNQGNIAAAEAEYCRATQDLERLRMSLKARLARVARDHDSALASVHRYDTQILPKAKESLQLSEQAYAAAEFNFLQVLVARRTYFESNLKAVDARRRLSQADAQVEGLLLTGGLTEATDLSDDDGLRGQALSGQ